MPRNGILGRLMRVSWHLGFVHDGLSGVFSDDKLKIDWVKNPYDNQMWFADPFILDITDKQIIVLVEEVRFHDPKGRISKLTIDKETLEIIEVKPIIEGSSHKSFPNIIRKDGKIYIYPENAKEGDLKVYEYDPVTSSATYVTTICDDCIWDSCISDLFDEPLMFTANHNDYYLDIYKWDKVCNKFIWAETIESADKNSRMAGQLFEYCGNIYAPFQNCSRIYGGNIDIKRVDYQDGNFSFEVVKRLFSPHKKYDLGLHTLNEYKGLVIIDVFGYNHRIGKLIRLFVNKLKHI